MIRFFEVVICCDTLWRSKLLSLLQNIKSLA